METIRSKRFRRAAGPLSVAALAVGGLSGVMGFPILAEVGLVAFLALPWLAFIAHLAVTNVLTSEEKAVWRRELWSSPRSIIAVWAYLLASDLPGRTKGFRPYKADS